MDRDKFDELLKLSNANNPSRTPPAALEPEPQGRMQVGFDVVEVQRIGLQPGDVLAVTVKNDDLSQDSVDALRKQLQLVFPNNKVFVFAMGTNDDVQLSVISQVVGGGGAGGPAQFISVANDCSTSYCSNCNCGKKESFEVKPSELNAEEIQALKELNEIEDEHMKRLAEQAKNGTE